MDIVQINILNLSKHLSGPTYLVALFISKIECDAVINYIKMIVIKYIKKRPENAFSYGYLSQPPGL